MYVGWCIGGYKRVRRCTRNVGVGGCKRGVCIFRHGCRRA